MANQKRVEKQEQACLVTTRTAGSALWFVRVSSQFYEEILGYLAKYQQKYGVLIYSFPVMGNHYHLIAQFPGNNRAQFMRDFNSQVARVSKRHVVQIPSGPLWGDRFAAQSLDDDASIREYFFYCALQAINSGLTERIEEYPGYNSLRDSLRGKPREHAVVNWKAYHNAKRFNPKVDIKRYTTWYPLEFTRLPGYEGLSQREYREAVMTEVERRRLAAVAERKAAGGGFAGRAALLKTEVGARPQSTKKRDRKNPQPISLAQDAQVREEAIQRYRAICAAHKKASKQYLAGDFDTVFPSGTYRPPLISVVTAVT